MYRSLTRLPVCLQRTGRRVYTHGETVATPFRNANRFDRRSKPSGNKDASSYNDPDGERKLHREPARPVAAIQGLALCL